MAITVMGGGTKLTTEDVNLDPQKQFWSFLSAFAPDTTGKIAGFPVQQATPAGLSVQVGGASTDSAIITLDGRKYLLSTDGEAQTVELETAPSANSRIDAIVSYLDFSDTDSSSETPGTPEYVKTIAVAGTVASSPSAPTDAEIQAALPASANGIYIQWGTVAVATGATQIVDSDITVNSITVAASKEDVLETAQDLTALNNSGVVRSDNIDWTTMTGSFPVATATATMMYGTTVNLARVANIVFATFSGRNTSDATATGTSSEKIPSGYRPTKTVLGRGVVWLGGTETATCQINTTGTIFWWTTDTIASGTEWNGGFVYPTNDDFPS